MQAKNQKQKAGLQDCKPGSDIDGKGQGMAVKTGRTEVDIHHVFMARDEDLLIIFRSLNEWAKQWE